MSSCVPEPFEEQNLNDLEAAIFAAGNLITPSDDHRPRTLECAAEAHAQKKTEQRIRGFVLSMMLLGAFSGHMEHFVETLQSQFAVPKSTEVQLRAAQLARENPDGIHWGLSDAIFEMRSQQGTILHPQRDNSLLTHPLRGNSSGK